MKNRVITISREFGSGGRTITLALQKISAGEENQAPNDWR